MPFPINNHSLINNMDHPNAVNDNDEGAGSGDANSSDSQTNNDGHAGHSDSNIPDWSFNGSNSSHNPSPINLSTLSEHGETFDLSDDDHQSLLTFSGFDPSDLLSDSDSVNSEGSGISVQTMITQPPLDCAICLSDLQPLNTELAPNAAEGVYTLDCGHAFHTLCLAQLIISNQRNAHPSVCPLDRGHISPQTQRYIVALAGLTLPTISAAIYEYNLAVDQSIKQNDENCSVCLDRLLPVVSESTQKREHLTLACGHSFHRECMDKWSLTKLGLNQQPNCPQDRSPCFLPGTIQATGNTQASTDHSNNQPARRFLRVPPIHRSLNRPPRLTHRRNAISFDDPHANTSTQNQTQRQDQEIFNLAQEFYDFVRSHFDDADHQGGDSTRQV